MLNKTINANSMHRQVAKQCVPKSWRRHQPEPPKKLFTCVQGGLKRPEYEANGQNRSSSFKKMQNKSQHVLSPLAGRATFIIARTIRVVTATSIKVGTIITAHAQTYTYSFKPIRMGQKSDACKDGNSSPGSSTLGYPHITSTNTRDDLHLLHQANQMRHQTHERRQLQGPLQG